MKQIIAQWACNIQYNMFLLHTIQLLEDKQVRTIETVTDRDMGLSIDRYEQIRYWTIESFENNYDLKIPSGF